MNAALEDRLARLLGYLEADPDNYPLLCEAGDICLQLGDRASARPLLESALTLQPEEPGALHRMSVFHFQEKEWESSLTLTQKILGQGEQHVVVRHQHTLALIQLGRFAEAEPLLAALLDENANFPELPHMYIRTLHYLGKLDEGAQFAQDYLKGNPEDVVANGMLSLLYLDQDKFTEASETARKVLATAPNNLDALIAAGSTAIGLERYEEAKELFERSIAVNSSNGRGWLGLGLNAMLEGDLAQASGQLEKAVQYMPGHLGSWNTLAWAQILQRDFDGAERTLKRCLDIDGNFGETHGGLAVVAAMRGKWDDAKLLTQKALRLQPDSFSGRYAQSLLLAQRGRPQQASALVDAMLDTFIAPSGGNLKDLIQRFAVKRQSQLGKNKMH